MLRARHAERDLDHELAVLARQHAGVIHERRMEHLADRLRMCTAGLAVRQSWAGLAGDRLTLHLDDGQVMKLALFWPRRVPIAAVTSVRWLHQVGWEVRARDAAGLDVPLYAWRARLFPG